MFPLVRGETGDLPPAQPDLSGRRRLEPGDHPERGGLAAAARPDQTDDVALLSGERGFVDGKMIAELLAYVAELEPAHRPHPRQTSSRTRSTFSMKMLPAMTARTVSEPTAAMNDRCATPCTRTS